MENNTQLSVEVVEQIKQEGQNMLAFAPDNKWSYIQGATAYATKLHQLQQENADLKRWKQEAAELLTKIHSYAHKHLEIKLGESIVDFVIARAKERDELKQENNRLKIAMENIYRIHGHQWNEHDRKVIKDLIK